MISNCDDEEFCRVCAACRMDEMMLSSVRMGVVAVCCVAVLVAIVSVVDMAGLAIDLALAAVGETRREISFLPVAPFLFTLFQMQSPDDDRLCPL